jgi:SAM-dependent methyltransferase
VAEPFKDHFSALAAGYRAFRPGYPAALLDWLAAVTPERRRAVDLGCGTGQLSVGLGDRFEEVVALDPSAEQIARAEPHPRVRYAVAPAEATGLPGGCADLVTAAQSFHWFDPLRVQAELDRLARTRAVFAAVTYDLCRLGPPLDEPVGRLYRQVLGPYWPPERAHVDAAYRTLPFPWPELAAPPFQMESRWTLERFLGYLATWSAVAACRRATGRDPLAAAEPELRAAWGPPEAERLVRWPLAVRAGWLLPRR